MDDDDDNDEAPTAPTESVWEKTKAIFTGFIDGDEISNAFEGDGNPFAEDTDNMHAEKIPQGGRGTAETEGPFEKLAEKETPAASIWKKMVTAGINRLSNLKSHLFVSEDDEDDIDDGIGDAFQVGLLETTHDMTKDAGTSGTLTKIKEVLRVTGAG